MESIIAYCLENWADITLITLAFFAFGWLLWKIFSYIYAIKNIKQKVDNLPCIEHEGQINKIDNLQKKVNEIDDKLIAIGKWIVGIDNKMIDEMMGKASPYKILPIGQELLNLSSGKKTIDTNLPFFVAKIDSKEPKTALDVEDYAFGVLLESMNNEMFNELKDFVYYEPEIIKIKNPESEEIIDVKISMPALIRLMSVYLRDEYFQYKENHETGNKFVEQKINMRN